MLSPQVCVTRFGPGTLRIEMRAALIAAVAALALSACGGVGAGGSPPGASPSTGPGLKFDVAVSEMDKTASMRIGQKLEAVLHARQGMANWSSVQSTDTSVLAPIVNPAASAARGITLAAFQAIAAGKAQITATAGASCSPGMACPQYVMLLTIDVTVSA
jgi:hypothetical protein